MNRTISRIFLFISLFLLVAFTIIVINQTAQVVQLARGVHPRLGDAVLWGLIFAYAVLLLMPAVLWLRLPKQLRPPASTDGSEYEAFMASMRKRLSRNRRLEGHALSTHADIEAALQKLNTEADKVISKAASTVFLSTAVSQSGRLDGLVVLVAQGRLVWQVAHTYEQRPSIREFVHLYANVASTALVASDVEDIDVDGLLGTFFGSGIAALPGMHLLASSVLSGAANAFLTLRVGMIAKQYCDCLVRVEKRSIRRTATVQAAKLIGRIVKDGVARMTSAAAAVPKEKMRELVEWVTAKFQRAANAGGQVVGD